MPGFELFGDEEKREVNDVLESGILMRYGFDTLRNGHWKARELEREIQVRLGVNHAHLTTSGTTALSLAMAVLRIGLGDEVILPTFTFVASFESVLLSGAIPIFADIDATLTLDPISVEKKITDKTKAIIAVHMCGAMSDLDALREICDRHHLFLIEDACQAFGGTYHGDFLGTIGDIGCFSFDYVKTITCGEGGAIVTNRSDLSNFSDVYSDHGHDHLGKDRGLDGHPYLGYNYRISELNAAVGLGQIRKIDEILAIQRKNKRILKEALSAIPEIFFRKIPDEAGDNAGFLSFFMETKELSDSVMAAFTEGGIDSCWNYYENNWHYIRKWDHLKAVKSLYPLSPEVRAGLSRLKMLDFSQSDGYISRNISHSIKLSWSEEEVMYRAERMVKIIKSVLR